VVERSLFRAGYTAVFCNIEGEEELAVAGVDALLGKTGVVTERIAPGGTGRVKVEGEDWRGASSDVLEPGTLVTIIQVDGTTLMVEKEL